MSLRAEVLLSSSLRGILAQGTTGSEIEGSVQFRDVFAGLEYFLPKVLGELYPEWRARESLDGFLPYCVRKLGDHELEFIGHCILITDQTTTPIYFRLQLALEEDEVTWLELKLGERGENGMVRRPYRNPPSLGRIAPLKDGIDAIDWVY